MGEVIRRANTTHYGLAAGVFTRSLDVANTLSRALRAGTVWVNCYDVFDATIPFGGYKMSGVWREKGIYALRNYLQTKAVVTPIKDPRVAVITPVLFLTALRRFAPVLDTGECDK